MKNGRSLLLILMIKPITKTILFLAIFILVNIYSKTLIKIKLNAKIWQHMVVSNYF